MANLGTSSAQGQLQGMKFTAQLSGKDESPSVDSTATGTAQLQLSPDGKELTYDLTTKDLKGFMMAHIHQGKAGQSGPIKLTQSANNIIVESEFPSIASFENDVYLVWQENSTGFFDVLLKKSTDGGNTFSDRPINLSKNKGNSSDPEVFSDNKK